jgi:capsular polysaccharide biosynthesis protein
MKVQTPEILKRLVRRFGLLLLLTLIGAGAGGAYGTMKTPTYQAQSYVSVAPEAQVESIAALNYAQAYGKIVTKGPVADMAKATLGVTSLGQATAATSPDAPIIGITVVGPDRQRVTNVANALAKALVDFGNGRRTETRVSLAIFATASVPASPISPKPPLELAVGAAGGLLIGALAVLAGIGRGRRRTDAPAAPTPPTTAPTMPIQPTNHAFLFAATQPIPVVPAITPGPSEQVVRVPEQKALGWYDEAAVLEYLPVDADGDRQEVEPDSGDTDKIVGRAVVIYRSNP